MWNFKRVIKCALSKVSKQAHLKEWSNVEFENGDQMWTFKRVIKCGILKV